MRRLNDSLAIGDMRDGELHSEKFDRVVSLAGAEYTTESEGLVHHPLRDGENDFADFAAAVETVREGLRSDDSMLVHCQAGASRSVTVLATALAAENETHFDSELYTCQMTGVYPSPELLDLAKEYLESIRSDETKES